MSNKTYNLVLVELLVRRRDDGSIYYRRWDLTLLGSIVLVFTLITAFLLGAFVLVNHFEGVKCDQIAEVTGLSTQYRTISGCFLEVEKGVWVKADAYFVGKLSNLRLDTGE